MHVIIGIDPHKATHTAVAIGDREDEISRLKVRATRDQVAKLLTWAAPFPSRCGLSKALRGSGSCSRSSSLLPARVGESLQFTAGVLDVAARCLMQRHATGTPDQHATPLGATATLNTHAAPSPSGPAFNRSRADHGTAPIGAHRAAVHPTS